MATPYPFNRTLCVTWTGGGAGCPCPALPLPPGCVRTSITTRNFIPTASAAADAAASLCSNQHRARPQPPSLPAPPVTPFPGHEAHTPLGPLDPPPPGPHPWCTRQLKLFLLFLVWPRAAAAPQVCAPSGALRRDMRTPCTLPPQHARATVDCVSGHVLAPIPWQPAAGPRAQSCPMLQHPSFGQCRPLLCPHGASRRECWRVRRRDRGCLPASSTA